MSHDTLDRPIVSRGWAESGGSHLISAEVVKRREIIRQGAVSAGTMSLPPLRTLDISAGWHTPPDFRRV